MLTGLLLGCSSTTDENSSMAIRKKMDAILKSSDSAEIKLMHLEPLRFELAQAYNNENKPDEAIPILQKLIEENRNPHDPIFGTKFKMSAPFYGMEAIYFKELAKSYALQKDAESEKKALKKAEQAQAMKEKLKPIEDERNRIEEKKKKDALLN